jgi:hypothetical protein
MSERSSSSKTPTLTLPPSSLAEELVEYEHDLACSEPAVDSELGWSDETGWPESSQRLPVDRTGPVGEEGDEEEAVPPTQRSPASRLAVHERPISVTMVSPVWDSEAVTERRPSVKVA